MRGKDGEDKRKRKEERGKVILVSEKWAVHGQPVSQPRMDCSVKVSEILRSLKPKWQHCCPSDTVGITLTAGNLEERLKLYCCLPRFPEHGQAVGGAQSCSMSELLGTWDKNRYGPVTRKRCSGMTGGPFQVVTSAKAAARGRQRIFSFPGARGHALTLKDKIQSRKEDWSFEKVGPHL